MACAGKAVKIIAAFLRPADKVFRYDASKFLVRLAGADLTSGKQVIKRLRDAVTYELTSVDADGVAFQMTASFGMALLDPEVEAMESIDRADQALTLAKVAGGNRMVIWDPSVTTGVRLGGRALYMLSVRCSTASSSFVSSSGISGRLFASAASARSCSRRFSDSACRSR